TTAQGVWKLGGNAPDLAWLFDVRRWSGDPANIDFSTAARKALAGIMHNHEAGQLIVAVGFPYIASLTWQSGLFHPTRGGLWLTTSYGKGKSGANPVRAPFSSNITALSVATYFTLLAQGRLVDDASSDDIKKSLRHGCVTGLFPLNSAVASKCGIYGEWLHDCALIQHNGLRYVVVGLTKTRRPDYAKYSQLFSDLDNLIVRNNRSPKPGC
ncbi:MAG TPA: serine hydrolase, partial [Pyrinomonadaceae bacterium]